MKAFFSGLMGVHGIGVSGSFFRGGQQLHPAKIQSLLAEIYSCQGGSFVLPSCSTKLFCQAVLPNCSANGQIGRWMTEKQAKIGEKQESLAETNQKWHKTDKNNRKTFKMFSVTNYPLLSFPFLSCQASISVLPSSLFCPAKLINFSRGLSAPPQIRLCIEQPTVT